MLTYEVEIRGDPDTTDAVVRVLVEEKDRLERMRLAASQSPLPTSEMESPDEAENQVESAAEFENQDIVMNLSNNAGRRELAEQDTTACVEQDLVEVAETLKRAERIVVLVGAGISTNCGIPVSRLMHSNEQTYF